MMKHSNRPAGYYLDLWDTMEYLVEPITTDQTERSISRVLKLHRLYIHVGAITGFPWFIVGAIHMMEGNCERLRRFSDGALYMSDAMSWRDEAIDFIQGDDQFRTAKSLHLQGAELLRLIEAHNGFGYAKRGVHSPYLWSGSNHGVGVGKFVSDGQYDPDFVSKQVGAAVLLKKMARRGHVSPIDKWRINTKWRAK